jgi:hypothetical protein
VREGPYLMVEIVGRGGNCTWMGKQVHCSKRSEPETRDCDDATLPSCLTMLLEGVIV